MNERVSLWILLTSLRERGGDLTSTHSHIERESLESTLHYSVSSQAYNECDWPVTTRATSPTRFCHTRFMILANINSSHPRPRKDKNIKKK